MPLFEVNIGSVKLTEEETPEELALGGFQSLAIHPVPGGGRIAQKFGAYAPEQINWKGFITGQDAQDRSKALDQLRIDAEEIDLTWQGYRFTGVVQNYVARERSGYIEYEIEFRPLIDQNNPGTAGSTTSNGSGGITQLINNAFTQLGLFQ